MFPTLLALCEWNPLVMWNFNDFYVVTMNKLLNKHLSCRWFDTPWWSCDPTVMKCTHTHTHTQPHMKSLVTQATCIPQYIRINYTHAAKFITIPKSRIITSTSPIHSNVMKLYMYRKTSNIKRTLVGNKIVNHSDVVGASPVGAAPTTSSFSTSHLASRDLAKKAARQYENLLSFGIWCVLY